MVRLFRGKYRIDTIRLSNWDYGWNGAYFVTICTKNRFHWFGNVRDGKMKLSEIGKLADQCWLSIPDHFPFVKLGNHVIMPDHVHGIIIIDRPVDIGNPAEAQDLAPLVAMPKKPLLQSNNIFGPQSKNLASIIRGYKIGVTKNARKIHPDFMWQSRYYDRIIRDEMAYRNISRYIRNNPVNWMKNLG
ncbi:transposase [Fulvivirga sedimenti]|uniref:Transposase n=1 Tax=Fulvivirga sedimenti TaxID=2879465 RepID=A0A9X1KWD2_9BACT|nr:transposase [Fulvivirga sedimenti]MCA6074645.1 transposase [Fulvivirga sedimenti]MCA6075822.1 transposase [Fulvivirga sedimenti]MCA6076950.1 transposase [Fulvivirga sedimenti]